MRVAVLSDLHANLHAVEAVTEDMDRERIDAVWCLGDVVGYGAHPREVLAWVESRADIVLKGNHDEAVASGDTTWFNPMAASAARAHAHTLAPDERARVYAWRESAHHRSEAGDDILLVHASPDDPLHEYVQPGDARLGLRRWEGRADLILLGHTHRPFVARLEPPVVDAARAWSALGFAESFDETRATNRALLVVNPGSVGQPRDGDPRASYAVLDLAARTVALRRVRYDVDAAAQAILKQGLDQLLALRLYDGR